MLTRQTANAFSRLRSNKCFYPRVWRKMNGSAADVAPIESNGTKRRHEAGYRFKNKKQKKAAKAVKEGSNEEVLLSDIRALLEKFSLSKPSTDNSKESSIPLHEEKLPQQFSEVTLTISELSSTGDGLAFDQDLKRAFVVPFTAPGDVVTAKVVKHFSEDAYSLTDFVKVLQASPKRDDSRIRCPYFARCSGCQFQMLSYEDQLLHKKTIVEKAYKRFSGLESHLVPAVGETMGSPLQYGYRTKLTPHFDGPPGERRDRRHGIRAKFQEVPPIGFMQKGTRKTIDIEDCPIGTDAVRMGMKRERERVSREIDTYARGATILLRENTKRAGKSGQNGDTAKRDEEECKDVIFEDRGDYIHEKTCITDNNATSTEYVEDFVFTNPAGAFFQNNNSILPSFTAYIRQHILPRGSNVPEVKNLIDAYSGSGLFTITLSSILKHSMGIDISSSSIECATKNAKLNRLSESQASFMAADAAHLFQKVKFAAEETVVVINPPRKGCDNAFLEQLLQYSPARIVYVSCNVHTQARDVGVLVGGMDAKEPKDGSQGSYELESLRGFDFFPQTGHVEGVAVLSKKTIPLGKVAQQRTADGAESA